MGYDRDDSILRGFAALGIECTREQFALRTDDRVVYGRLVAAGAGIGLVAACSWRIGPAYAPCCRC